MIGALLLVLAAYLAGAVPSSLWTGRVFYGKDLRALGSRNLGATNALRVLGPKAAVPVLLFDVFKGFAPAWWFPQIGDRTAAWWTVAYGGAAIVGHVFSVWVRFRGGKGIATSAGVLIAAAPVVAAGAAAVWLAVLLAARKVSAASLAAALAVLPVALAAGEREPALLGFLALLTGLVAWSHRSNIRRLRAGEEPGLAAAGAAAGADEDEAGP